MKKHLIALDFLSIGVELKHNFVMIEGQKTKVFNKTTLHLTNRKTPNFSEIYDIEVSGLIVGELRYRCNKPTIGEKYAIIKFSNELLYSINLYGIYQRIKSDIKFRFNKINQVDIALDQSATDDKHIKFAYDYARGKIQFVGSQQVRIDFQKQVIRSVYIGARQSGKFIRCYYKKQELQVSNKLYISEYWQKNNLDTTGEVFRTELSLSGSITNKIYTKDFGDNEKDYYFPFLEEKTLRIIQSGQFLNDVFQAETKNFTKVVKVKEYNMNKGRANLCRQWNIFKHLEFNHVLIMLTRIKQEASKIVHKIKMASKFLYQMHIETGQYFFKALSGEIADYENLNEWRESKLFEWQREHEKKLENPIYKRYFSAFNDLKIHIV
jgi:hypothetical protein